jgi:branched-chain amino acid transport system ATP-binding protein
VLKVNNINTQYESVQVLFDVSFNIEKGEVVSLLGANGAGKSSTLRTIIGIARSETGSIYFDNERIDKKEPNRIIELGIAIVPEGRRLFPKLTVLENLKMGALFVKSEGEFRRNLDKVYSLFPILNERKDQLAGTFSGGEQGMLTIGRAIISNPKIMLMDEPSLGLAPIIVAQVFESIKKINHEGTTILLVEQNASQALQIASRGYVLQKGKIIVGGKVEELMVSEIIKKAYLTI